MPVKSKMMISDIANRISHSRVQGSHLNVRWPLLVAGVMILSGCAITADKTSDVTPGSKAAQQAEPIKDSQQKPLTDLVESENLNIDSQTMFEIMAAEMMVKRQQPKSAFSVLYPIAERIRDKALVQRLFQISMRTYDLPSIEQATLLWREVEPESSVAWRASFILSLRKGQVDEALDQWQKYQQLSELDLSSDLIASASKVAATVQQEFAVPFFQSLVNQYDTEWAAHYGLGMVCSVHKNTQVGIPALERAESLLIEAGEQDSVSLIYNLLSKLYLSVTPPQQGIEKLRPYLAEHPDDLLVQERVARLEVQAKRYDEAEQRYQLIVDQEPAAYTSLFSLALLQLERESFDDAEQNLLRVSQQKGYQSVAFYYLGVLYQDKNDFESAKNYFARVNTAGYQVDAKLHLAEIAYAEGEQAQAYAYLDAIDSKNASDQVKVLRAKAIFAASDRDFNRAIDYYNQALQIEPNNIEVLKAQSLLFYKVEDFQSYETSLLKVLKVDELDSDALNALGYFYVERNIKLSQAYSLLNQALKLQPDSFYILDSMGWYYYQVGQYQKALEYLTVAFEKSEDDEVLVHLISAYWQNGEQAKAKSIWQQYRQKFPANEKVQNILNELSSSSN